MIQERSIQILRSERTQVLANLPNAKIIGVRLDDPFQPTRILVQIYTPDDGAYSSVNARIMLRVTMNRELKGEEEIGKLATAEGDFFCVYRVNMDRRDPQDWIFMPLLRNNLSYYDMPSDSYINLMRPIKYIGSRAHLAYKSRNTRKVVGRLIYWAKSDCDEIVRLNAAAQKYIEQGKLIEVPNNIGKGNVLMVQRELCREYHTKNV